MTDKEEKLLQILMESEDKEKAIEIAIHIISGFLDEPEKERA